MSSGEICHAPSSKLDDWPTPSPTVNDSREEIVIAPGQTERAYFRDLLRYRELFWFLAWRDVLVRYKQTVIGVAWAVLRPLLTTAVFVLVFSKVAKLPSEGSAPYPILVFTAMLAWTFFATALSESSNSLVSNANLISKVYFPRLIVPAASVITTFLDFLIGLVILALMMAIYRFAPDWRVLCLPAFVLLAVAASLGAGIWLSALTVAYRDFRFITPFLVQFGLYLSPVGFSSGQIPGQWRLLYSLNPMVGVIDGFRWCLLGGQTALYWPAISLALLISAALLVTGVLHFRRTERTFADII